MWPELSSHSVAYLRTRRWKQGLQEEWQCQSSGRSFEQHLWAALVVQTRALSCAQHLLLCPGLDLSNHVSVGPTARVKVEQDRVVLLAEYALDAGQEVTMSYYPEADYLDLFEALSIFGERRVRVRPMASSTPPAWCTPWRCPCHWRRCRATARSRRLGATTP